jgi:hypothetical protein
MAAAVFLFILGQLRRFVRFGDRRREKSVPSSGVIFGAGGRPEGLGSGRENELVEEELADQELAKS